MGSASATTGSVRCRHAATAGHRHARAQVARRAVALRASTPAAPAATSAGGRARWRTRARCPCRPATTTSIADAARARPRRRRLVPDARCACPRGWAGERDRAALRRRHAPRASCGSTTRRSPSTRAATRRSRPTSPTSSRRASEHRITVVVNNALTWQSIPPGRRRGHARRPPPALLPRLLQLRRPAPLGLAVRARRAAHVDDVTVVTGLDGADRHRRLRGRDRGRRRREVRVALRDADGAEVARGDRRGGRADASTDVHPWRPGEGYLYDLDGRAAGRRRRVVDTLHARRRHPHRRGRRHASSSSTASRSTSPASASTRTARCAARATTTPSWSTTSR